jgi:isocitrate dehydrogenase
VPRLVPGWTKPIIVGRHAFGDQYRATDFRFPGKGKLTIKFVGEDGPNHRARSVRRPRLRRRHGDVQPRRVDPRFRPRVHELRPAAQGAGYLSTKNTILKAYDGRFKDIFQEVSTRPSSRTSSQGSQDLVRAPPDRRHGRGGAEMVRRLCLGLQEL